MSRALRLVFALVGLVLVTTCSPDARLVQEKSSLSLQADQVVPSAIDLALELVAPPVVEEPVIDPYEGWESWCETRERTECINDSDCPTDRTGRATTCRKHKGALEGDPGHCKPMPLNRRRQKIQIENLRVVVDGVCKPPTWWNDVQEWGRARKWGDDAAKLCLSYFGGRSPQLRECITRAYCDPDRLHDFLRIPCNREATYDHQTDHRLNPDQIANYRSYQKAYRKGRYEGSQHFYEGLSLDDSGRARFAGFKRVTDAGGNTGLVPQKLRDCRYGANQHDQDCNGVPDRWEVGLGWYGANVSNFTYLIDKHAPPEILCKRSPATRAVLRRMRKAWHKLTNGIDCKDANGVAWGRENKRPKWRKTMSAEEKADMARDTWVKPTWWTLHRAVWGGDLCPSDGDDLYQRRFEQRATHRRVQLAPHEEVTLPMLGRPIPDDEQHVFDARIEAQFKPIWE